MRLVFADTGYWIALVNPRDQIHTKAVSVTQELSPVRIVTSEMVLAEVLNSFSDAARCGKLLAAWSRNSAAIGT